MMRWMDGWPRWVDGFRVEDGAKTTRPAPACYGTVSRLARQRQSWGVGLRAVLASSHKGKELGWTHLDLDDQAFTSRAWR